MAISKGQAMRPALNDVIDAVNQIGDIEPYITAAVVEWLDAHPEATTTVEDGSITYIKLATSLVDWLMSKYAERTPYDAFAPMLTAGAALGITGNVTESAAWLQRVSTSDGPATVKGIHGRTLRWNQLYKPTDTPTTTSNGITVTNNGDGSITVGGTSTGRAIFNLKLFAAGALISGHKYLVKGCSPAGGSSSTWWGGIGGSVNDTGSGGIRTITTSGATQLRFDVLTADITVPETTLYPQFFDLTAMFGAGNEPATVDEFTALYPELYYEYDAGSLLSVNMEGIETVGFNQWDEEWELGSINNADGENATSALRLRSKNYIPVFPDTDYYFRFDTAHYTGWFSVKLYDASKSFISTLSPNVNTVVHIPSGVQYIRFNTSDSWNGIPYTGGICINLSDPTRNGEYEPYWSAQREIAASTYFPDGMRSAGTVRDELTATQAITRIGERAYQSGDESDATVITDGTVTHYALSTPTTVEIDPPLNLTYRTETDGTERVMVPTGETSAPPTIVAAQGYTAESLRDAALSAIAPVENGTASTNYGVGAYLVHAGQLCKVTVAIASGEAISIGTNVVATTVMAEILSLVQ